MHTFPDGMKYIGQTTTLPKRRFYNGNGYKKQPDIWNHIQHFGWESVKTEILYSNIPVDELRRYETRSIDRHNTYLDGLNRDRGQGHTSEETRQRLSESQTHEQRSECAKKWHKARTPEQQREITQKTLRARTHEQRSESARKWQQARTPKQRSENARKGKQSMTPEQRREAARKAQHSRTSEERSKTARKRDASLTPEQRRERSRKAAQALTPEQRSERARKAAHARTPKQRSESARKRQQARTPKQRSESARKAVETKRIKGTSAFRTGQKSRRIRGYLSKAKYRIIYQYAVMIPICYWQAHNEIYTHRKLHREGFFTKEIIDTSNAEQTSLL